MKHFVFLRRLSEGASWGGCESQLMDYFSHIDPASSRITLATTQDIFSERFSENNVLCNIVLFPFKFPKAYWHRFCLVYKYIKSLKPDKVIFVQGCFIDFLFPDFFAGFLIARGNIYSLEVLGAEEPPKRKKYFGLIFAREPWWYKHLFFEALKGWLCKRVLTVSQDVTDRLRWYNFPQHKIVTVYWGVDVDIFAPNIDERRSIRRHLGISDSDFLIISTGRLSQEKRIELLINVFDRLHKAHSNAHLLLVGDGPERARLEELAAGKISSKNIYFIGHQLTVLQHLQASDVFVVSSDVEGLCLSLLEAMAVKLVCIATKTAGPCEILRNSKCGFLVEHNEDCIFAALKESLNMTNTARSEMGARARERVREQFQKGDARKRFFEQVGLVLSNK